MAFRHRLALFVLLSICRTFVTATQPKSACQSCVTGLASMHGRMNFLISSEDSLHSEACLALPSPQQQELCRAASKATLPVLEGISQRPIQACGDLGICNKTEAVVLAASPGSNDLQCQLCEYVMSTIKEELQDPETEADLLAQASQICETLPDADSKRQCLQYIAKYGKQLFEWVHEETSQIMCVQAGFCSPSTRLQPLPPHLVAAASRLFSSQNDDQCSTCQAVVAEASTALSDPKTQKEILEYIKENCKTFQSLADQCADYIDLYGPLVLSMARQYLSPDLCNKLGFCSAAAAQIMIS